MLITFTVMEDSWPSRRRKSPAATPAFSIRASRRGRLDAFAAKDLTESYDDKSRFQTSMAEGSAPVVSRMSDRASSPALVLRQAMISFETPRRTMCRAASLPRPVLPPVTMATCQDVLAGEVE